MLERSSPCSSYDLYFFFSSICNFLFSYNYVIAVNVLVIVLPLLSLPAPLVPQETPVIRLQIRSAAEIGVVVEVGVEEMESLLEQGFG